MVVIGGEVTVCDTQRDDQATLPYVAAESVGDAILAQVVVV